MLTLKSKIEIDNFIAAFGDYAHIKPFSREAIELVLASINNKDPSSWHEYFIGTSEIDSCQVISHYKYQHSELATPIINIARNLDIDPNTEIGKDLASDLDDTRLLPVISHDLRFNDLFISGMADVIAKHNDLKKLGNGKYLFVG